MMIAHSRSFPSIAASRKTTHDAGVLLARFTSASTSAIVPRARGLYVSTSTAYHSPLRSLTMSILTMGGIGKLGFLVQDVGARREHAGMALTFRFSVPVAGDYQMLFDILATQAEIKHV